MVEEMERQLMSVLAHVQAISSSMASISSRLIKIEREIKITVKGTPNAQ
jgi:hypothetical protein